MSATSCCTRRPLRTSIASYGLHPGAAFLAYGRTFCRRRARHLLPRRPDTFVRCTMRSNHISHKNHEVTGVSAQFQKSVAEDLLLWPVKIAQGDRILVPVTSKPHGCLPTSWKHSTNSQPCWVMAPIAQRFWLIWRAQQWVGTTSPCEPISTCRCDLTSWRGDCHWRCDHNRRRIRTSLEGSALFGTCDI